MDINKREFLKKFVSGAAVLGGAAILSKLNTGNKTVMAEPQKSNIQCEVKDGIAYIAIPE